MANRVNHQEVVKKLLDAKAVDFAAIGKVLAELGPTLSLADESGDYFCGTGRNFFHCYGLPPGTTAISVENLAALRSAARELKD
jgi:hypothetical protein